jgi:hypothetical protein
MENLLFDILPISFSKNKSQIYLNKSINYLSEELQKKETILDKSLICNLSLKSKENELQDSYLSWFTLSILRSICHEPNIEIKNLEFIENIFFDLLNENTCEEKLGIQNLYFNSNGFEYKIPLNLPEKLKMSFDNWKEFESEDLYNKWELKFLKSLELINAINPTVLSEINLLVENILVVHSQNNSHGSMSPKNIMGTVYLPNVEDITLVAECLIHEGLHQYLYRIEHCSPLFNDADGINEIYYSPWKDEPRPLIMVLHGAFVFTGVIMYYIMLCQKNILPNKLPEFVSRLSHRYLQVKIALDVLDKNNKFTKFGSEVFEILQEYLTDIFESPFLDLTDNINDVLDHKLKYSKTDYLHASIS